MTNLQLYVAIGIPMLFNALLVGVLIAFVNAKFEAVNAKFDAKFDGVGAKFDGVDAKFDGVNGKFDGVNDKLAAINQRFDDMRDLWRAELRRVEEILDARLKHLEERR